MKVAFQLAANPRSFKRCYPSFKANIIDTLNPDIFIHTWRLHGRERPDVVTDGSCEEYIDLYKPKSWEVEDLHYNYQSLNTMVPHFTSRHRVNQLRKIYQKENDTKYDVIIMGRPDVRLIDPTPKNNSKVAGSEFKSTYAEQVKEDEIWTHHFKDGLPADYLFYCSPKWMDIGIDGCFNNLEKLNEYKPGSERLWWHILQNKGFKREQFKYYGNSIHDQDHIDNSFRFFDIECVR
jgi:hypothetical protein